MSKESVPSPANISPYLSIRGAFVLWVFFVFFSGVVFYVFLNRNFGVDAEDTETIFFLASFFILPIVLTGVAYLLGMAMDFVHMGGRWAVRAAVLSAMVLASVAMVDWFLLVFSPFPSVLWSALGIPPIFWGFALRGYTKNKRPIRARVVWSAAVASVVLLVLQVVYFNFGPIPLGEGVGLYMMFLFLASAAYVWGFLVWVFLSGILVRAWVRKARGFNVGSPGQALAPQARVDRRAQAFIAAGIVLAGVVGAGMLSYPEFFELIDSEKKEEPVLTAVDERSVVGKEDDIYVLSSKITRVVPLEVLNLTFEKGNAFLVTRTAGTKENVTLPFVGDYIKEVFKNHKSPSLEPALTLFKEKELVAVEIRENTGGMAPVHSLTVFTVDLGSSGPDKKLYTLRESFGNYKEGVSSDPILLTFFNKHDLILDCDPDQTEVKPYPYFRTVVFTDCNGLYFVEDYAKRKRNNIPYYNPVDKQYIYYNKDGDILEPKVLSIAQQNVVVGTRISELLDGVVRIDTIIDSEEDIADLRLGASNSGQEEDLILEGERNSLYLYLTP